MINMLGSCRLFIPLKMLHTGQVVTIQERWWGYTHSTKEILQVLNMIKKQSIVAYNEEVLDIINHSASIKPKWKKLNPYVLPFYNIDTFVIEVSTIRNFIYRGHFLQINRLRESFNEHWSDFAPWFNDLKNGTYVEPDVSSLDSEFLKDIALNTTTHVQSKSEFFSDLDLICEHLAEYGCKKIVFVNHIDVDFDGSRLSNRKFITDALNEYVETKASSNVSFINMRKLLLDYDLKFSLKDSSHYNTHFLPYVSKYFSDQLRSLGV